MRTRTKGTATRRWVSAVAVASVLVGTRVTGGAGFPEREREETS